MAVAVGMKNPGTLKEARTILDTYNNLSEETKPAASVLHSLLEANKLLKVTCRSLGERLKSSFDSQFQELKDIMQGKA